MTMLRIQYTVQPSFAPVNRKNIEKVMSDLQSLKHSGIRYSAFLLEDGKTFMHVALIADDEAMKALNALDSFRNFQAELKNSNPEAPPKFDSLDLVGSSFEYF